MRRVFILLAVTVVAAICWGQQQLIPDKGFDRADGETSSGTLNLILANRNGFVIAADSRRTASDGQYWDDSQKLFRVDKRSALVMAGFAAARAPGTPLDVQVSALLREHFDLKLQQSDVPFDGQDVSGWMRLTMAQELGTVGAVFGTLGMYQMDMIVIAAGYDAHHRPKITRFDFKPKLRPFGPSLTVLPVFETEVASVDVTGFKWESAGIDHIAKSVMAGTYPSEDERIVRYYAARERNQLDTLPLEALHQLAEAILSETKKGTVYVGGPDQIALFPRKGKARWLAPDMQSSKQRVLRTILWLGGPSNLGRRPDGQHYSMRTSVFEDLTRPVTEQYVQVFVSGDIHDVDVSLDGNLFAGFVFTDVTFKYRGGKFWFGTNNKLQQCEIEIEEGKVMPTGSLFASECRILHKPVVQIDAFTVAAPIAPKHVGCIIPTKNGSVKTKTVGKYKGQDCRGSHIEVTMGVPIPATRASRSTAAPPLEPR